MTRIGAYNLHVIETGYFALDGGAMFGVVPKPLWEKRMTPDGRNRIRLATRCLLLEDSDRLILVDNGLGEKYTEKFAHLYAVDHETASLDRSLAACGFSADDVTDVILTHLHFDHAGGSTIRRGERLDLAFKNAVHHVQRAQWETANSPNAREAPSFLGENLTPLDASGQLRLCDGATELFDGLSLEPYFGHTAAMQTVRVSDDERTLVFAADLLPTSHHLGAAWTMAYDILPIQTIDEKARFLDMAVEGGWTLFFEHDPDVTIADVEVGERGVTITRHRALEEM